MNYKRIIQNQQLRFKILHMLDWVSDSVMLQIQYKIKMGFWPDFKHPKRFTEKIQLYKMKYRNPVMAQCVDKFEVRKYVESKGLKNILNKLYGLYEKADNIDFYSLPDKFVVKSTTGGGGLKVIVVKDKSQCNLEDIQRKVTAWKQHKQGAVNSGREWAYSGINCSRIIIEKYLEDYSNGDGSLTDYKFFCFNGNPYCVQVDSSRFYGHCQNYYNMQWQSLGVHCSYPEGDLQSVPQNFEEMKQVAALLSKDFPFVRVDLYNVNGKIYFGELTFYPSSGYGKFHPDKFDMELGAYFTEYE